MKKFQFRLEAVLKLREFKEKKLKTELGQIQQEITALKEQIVQLKTDIQATYAAQDKIMSNPTSGQFLRFFPYYIQAKNDDIKNKEVLLEKLEQSYQAKLTEVKQARGETKVVESLKEKSHKKYKKEKEKQELQNIEELIMMRQQQRS